MRKYAIRLIRILIDFNENIEYIIQLGIKLCIDGKEWKDREGGLIIMKLICENKRDFLLGKKNYCKKVIESLVYGYKNCSELIQKHSAEILTNFLKKIPDFSEISILLPPEIITKIYELQNQSTTEINTKLEALINKSVNILSNPLNNLYNKEKYEYPNGEERLLNLEKSNNAPPNDIKSLNIHLYKNADGNMFGIFPQEDIEIICQYKELTEEEIKEGKEQKISYSLVVDKFNKIKEIFDEKCKDLDFLRYSSSFFKFLSFFLNQENNPNYTGVNSSSILLNILEMLDYLVSGISGVNLIASFYSVLPYIVFDLNHSNILVREALKKILNKIIMIIPTSQLIPYLINAISKNHDKWILIQECLIYLEYIFTHLNEIYNDIEWSNNYPTYDINIILEILKLWDHPVAKVKYHVKRVVKILANLSGNTEKFLKTLSYYTSETLQSEILKFFYGQSLSSNIITNAKNINNIKFDVATQRVLSALPQKLSMSLAKEQNDENLEIFAKMKKYDNVNKNKNMKYNGYIIDETLMKNISDKEPPVYIGKKEPLDNYPNYEIDKEENKDDKKQKGKAVKQILKSRLKRYNDPTEIKKEEIYDKDYIFEVRRKEELSPIKYNKKNSNELFLIYNEILNQMKNLLNWEKQFKAIDLFRKSLHHHINLIKSNKKYFYDLINALLQLSCSTRSLLAKNALVALEDLFEARELSYYDILSDIIRILIKKMNDKNKVIKDEAMKAMICLIMFLNVEKSSNIIVEEYKNVKNHDTICLVIMCFGFYLKYHREKIFNLANWNRMMVFVQEQYNFKRNVQIIRDACMEFFVIIRNYFRNEETFENYMKNYFSLQTMSSLLMFMNIYNPE